MARWKKVPIEFDSDGMPGVMLGTTVIRTDGLITYSIDTSNDDIDHDTTPIVNPESRSHDGSEGQD